MYPSLLENCLWCLNIGAAAALIARLYFQRLTRTYRLLVLYLAVDTLQSVLALIFVGDPAVPYLTYAAGQTLKVTLAIFIPMELFRLALVQQPALARFGRRMIGYFFAVAATLAALNVLFGAGTSQGNRVLGGFLAFERSMDLVALAVLILMSGYLLWFPVRTRRNTAICIAGFVIYSFQRWTGLLLVDLWPDYQRQFSTAMLCVSLAGLTVWTILLRRDGETSTVQTGHRWNPEEADRLRLQLDAINARLEHAGREKAVFAD
jgi:hypothetical protein